jgi:hypothetical protein
MVFGVLGLVITLATIIIGIIQIKIAWKHQHQTANCRIDLEAAVNLSSPYPGVVAVQKMTPELRGN